MFPQPDAARRKSDEDSVDVVQKGPDVISTRRWADSSRVKSVQHSSSRRQHVHPAAA